MKIKREPKSRFVVWIYARQLEDLTLRSIQTGAPMAELIRRALDAYLGTRKRKK